MEKAVVVGAGAAGLFAAGQLVKAGVQTTLVEHSAAPGRKILITGKGRCNVTNNCTEEEFLQNLRHGGRFMYSAINGFAPAAAMAFFEALGVPLKTERGARVFPQSDAAADILNALLRHAKGAKLVKGSAEEILQENGAAAGVRLAGGQQILADAVIVCTGGLSYPATGSTGAGYIMAAAAGHTIVPPGPSLVPLVVSPKEKNICAGLMGLSLKNVTLTLLHGQKKVYSEMGEMLFTHFGVSGPLVLSASAHMEEGETGYTLSIDLKPALSEETLYARICRDFEAAAAKQAKNALDALLPKAMVHPVLARWGTLPGQPVNQITKAQRQALVEILKNFTLQVAGKAGVEHAVITAGGVNTKEVNPKTMESKLLPGLYFAGEVLDIDGYTGGFNLQVAFATAFAAANAVAARR